MADRFLYASFAGFRVIGDVHGDAPSFAAAIAGARERRLFVVQLGDLVDRGRDSPGCLRLAMGLVARGDGLFLLGNHDDKLRRALAGNAVTVSGDLAGTLAALAAEPAAFRSEVLAALTAAPLWVRYGGYFMVHAGFDPMMLDYPHPDAMPTRRLAGKHANRALRGQTPPQAPGQPPVGDEDGHPLRLYDWIDRVPAGLTVLIGHDRVSDGGIVERRGAMGGRVLFLDTGCGKGGTLSWLDIPAPDR